MGRKYRNPPVEEAVCEFQFEPGEWDGAIPGLIYTQLQDPFSKREEAETVWIEFDETNGGPEPTLRRFRRVRYQQEDGRAFVDVGEHFLAVARLQPYESWAQLKPTIMRALREYDSVAHPRGISRVSLRYRNRFRFRQAPVKAEDHFDFYPYLGARLRDYDTIAFIVGVQMPFDEKANALRLEMTSASPEKGYPLVTVLEFDFHTLVGGHLSIATMEEWLDTAHERIEEVFESCIKEPLRRTFDEGE